MPLTILLADNQPFREETTMSTDDKLTMALYNQEQRDRSEGDRIPMASPAGLAKYDATVKYPDPPSIPRTLSVVAMEYQNALDAASRVARLRAELDALLGKKPRVRKAAAK